ncbi:MAG: SH3 domain-containing protein [Anaerolineae bacterium]|nr:SH3 domain-containing protein [Anaerolineae bacterium]
MKRLALLIVLILAGYAKPAFADPCIGAPPPRLIEGGEAVVIAGRLNVRALPVVEAGAVTQLYPNNRVTVIRDASCNGGYTWWRVESANGSRGWVAEGAWDQYYIVPGEDAEAPPTPFDVMCLRTFAPLYCL